MRISMPLRSLLGVAVAMGASSVASGAVIPVTGLKVVGGAGGNIAGNATDAQPTTDPVGGVAVPDAGGEQFALNGSGSSRALAFDFGEGFADVTITDTYLLMASYQIPSVDDTYHWSSDFDGAFEAGEGDVVATDFNILNVTVPAGYPGGGTRKWVNTYHSDTGITPQRRYLILTSNGGSEGNFKYEIAFVSVPEPASMALLALGGIAMLAGRRRPLARRGAR